MQRHLVTHTSGLAYDIFDPTLMKWRNWQKKGLSQGKTVPEKYSFPLLYEPGTRWSYSVGLDWAGLMVERVNGGMSLEDYMRANIWEPLGIHDITFHLDKREDLRTRMPAMSVREPSGSGKAVHKDAKMWDDPLDAAFGGAGAYASPSEYLKILNSLLVDDGKLMKSSTQDDMFQPQLSEESRASLMQICKDPALNNQLGGIPLGTQKDFAIGGLLLMEDLEGQWAKKGTMTWGGLPNLTWVCRPMSYHTLPNPISIRSLLTRSISGSIARQAFVAYTHPRSYHQAINSPSIKTRPSRRLCITASQRRPLVCKLCLDSGHLVPAGPRSGSQGVGNNDGKGSRTADGSIKQLTSNVRWLSS